ncbi:MAG: SurA N-terminal domain-containing protein [Candidatus Omnitrophica bacterium]|nr:SurA N-terminal domain-containing protein [Candidatus Omnitrophota bacterium]
MKNLIFVFIIAAFLVGCTRCDKPKDIAVKINNYEISKAEFEQEFKDSSFGRFDTSQSRKDFLENLVNRILIVQDAQKSGLDNDPQFLRVVEKFWMQSLLKLALEKKSNDLIGVSFVSDNVIKEAYEKILKDGKTTKSYEEMYQEIKRDITKLKESQMTNEWLLELHKNAKIHVNKDLILKDK